MTDARPIVALGDSITRGKGGAPALGVHPQPWVQWLAEALDVPLHDLAADGATAADLVRDQLPRVATPPTAATPVATPPTVGTSPGAAPPPAGIAPGAAPARPYVLATLFVGANDVRGVHFDAAAFEADVDTVLAALTAAADRVLVLTVPLDLGRPPAGHDVLLADSALRRRALAHGAVVCGLEDLHGHRVMLPDAVHPTSPGMVAIADRAADALAAAGVPVPRRPSELAEPRTDLLARARYDLWWLRQLARDHRRRARERR